MLRSRNQTANQIPRSYKNDGFDWPWKFSPTCAPFFMKNVHVVKQLLLDGTRSVLYHLIYEKMSEIIAIQPEP